MRPFPELPSRATSASDEENGDHAAIARGDRPSDHAARLDRRAQGKPWWRETELWVLLLMTACFYTIRVGDLSVRGEESRRGRIAWEMWQTGDWIVPRIQGQPVLFSSAVAKYWS